MTKKYEPPIANVVMGIGLETGADYGWNRAKETLVAAVESDTEVLLNQREKGASRDDSRGAEGS